jgi:hypothetical protein
MPGASRWLDAWAGAVQIEGARAKAPHSKIERTLRLPAPLSPDLNRAPRFVADFWIWFVGIFHIPFKWRLAQM